jgi:CheY-like chemotaxis protein/HPt (histidine-containing phosphotransfer) domain-containing protein
MPYGNILIVDDVETNLYVAKGLMLLYGLKIDLAASGFEAIDIIKAGNVYDIIIMDHMMPKLDGITATKIIREMGYTHPIVALTANALMGQAEMFLNNGFDDFISKPIDVRQLNVTLNRLIRDKQTQEVIDAANKEKAIFDKTHASGYQNVPTQLGELFASDAEKAIDVITSCMNDDLNDDGVISMYIINVHAMKSALANIGESELSLIAQRLELAGREKEINVLLTETNNFIEKVKIVVKEIKIANEDNEVVEDTEESLTLLNEKLGIIKEACTKFDKKTAKNVLSGLREKTWSSETKKLLRDLSEKLLHSDFDEAAILIDKFIN